MQTKEQDERQVLSTTPDPQSQPLENVPLTQDDESDDPEQIFIRAVAEIDTQPLQTKREPLTIGDVLEITFDIGLLLFFLFGSIYLAITYPHTLVIVYEKTKSASITTTLPIATRTLAPFTITRSATLQTTGTGHQNAIEATGTLIFYNGSTTPQYEPIGSVFTGNDGEKITTDQSITVPPANLPAIGSMPVQARAIVPGSQGNITAFDVNIALSPVLKVRNEAPFTNGRNARTYHAVAALDLQKLTGTVNDIVTQAFTNAFSLQPGEQDLPTNCKTKTTPHHQIGDEATSVSVTTVKTCSAIVYNSQQLKQQATTAFTQTKPGKQYHLVGSVQTTLQSVSPFTVILSGKWAYTFSPDYQQNLAESIAGKTPDQARKLLLRIGVIAYASVPSPLPPDSTYINFLVLV